MLALIVGSRFGLLLGLSLWLGVGVAALLVVPVLQRSLPSAQALDVVGLTVRRLEAALLGALALVLVGLGARVALDHAAPPVSLVGPVAVMTLGRLLSALAVTPALRAMRVRLRDANAPASDAERSAFGRLEAARSLLLTLEVCLALYALFAVS